MSQLGRSAIDDMGALLEALRTDLGTRLEAPFSAAGRAGALSPALAERQRDHRRPGRRVDPVALRGRPLRGHPRPPLREVCGREAELVASPGTYDQKHFARIAGIEQCVAYGPGPLEEAHQPDESSSVDDLVSATKVLALAALRLLG